MAVHNSVLSSFERLQPRYSPLARRRQVPRRERLESLQFITTNGRLISWDNGTGPRHLSLVSVYAIILYTFPLASVSLLLWIPFPCPPLLHLQHRLLFEDIRRSAAARLLRLRVRIPPGAWKSFCCECCVLSGRGLCDELITRPEKSYRL